MSLLEQIKQHVADPETSGLVMEVEYEPLNGPSAAVAPPTYLGENKTSVHAITTQAFMPQAGSGDWHSGIVRNEDGTPRLGARVVINSTAAQSGCAETALWQNQDRLGLRLPAIILDGRTATRSTDEVINESLMRLFSTWELAHRQNDAWVKFATADGKTLVWQQGIEAIGDTVDGSQVKSLISAATPERAGLLYRYLPNSAIYGYWISSGLPTRHKLPRAYSSEIVGYGATAVVRGATKLDPTGGSSSKTGVVVNADNSLTVSASSKTSTRPSLVGFGLVPGSPREHAYQCELILEQASISLQLLRSLKYETTEQAAAATTVLTLLALAGHALAAEDGFLRSGCALLAIDSRWGWRRRGVRAPETLPVASVDEISEALRAAITEAEATGLRFAEPITLQFSKPELEIIEQRVQSDATTLTTTDE